MNTVKLDSRYKLTKLGFPYAFKFDYYGDDARRVARTLWKLYGAKYCGLGCQNPMDYQWAHLPTGKPFYIAVREEDMITAVLLSV